MQSNAVSLQCLQSSRKMAKVPFCDRCFPHKFAFLSQGQSLMSEADFHQGTIGDQLDLLLRQAKDKLALHLSQLVVDSQHISEDEIYDRLAQGLETLHPLESFMASNSVSLTVHHRQQASDVLGLLREAIVDVEKSIVPPRRINLTQLYRDQIEQLNTERAMSGDTLDTDTQGNDEDNTPAHEQESLQPTSSQPQKQPEDNKDDIAAIPHLVNIENASIYVCSASELIMYTMMYLMQTWYSTTDDDGSAGYDTKRSLFDHTRLHQDVTMLLQQHPHLCLAVGPPHEGKRTITAHDLGGENVQDGSMTPIIDTNHNYQTAHPTQMVGDYISTISALYSAREATGMQHTQLIAILTSTQFADYLHDILHPTFAAFETLQLCQAGLLMMTTTDTTAETEIPPGNSRSHDSSNALATQCLDSMLQTVRRARAPLITGGTQGEITHSTCRDDLPEQIQSQAQTDKETDVETQSKPQRARYLLVPASSSPQSSVSTTPHHPNHVNSGVIQQSTCPMVMRHLTDCTVIQSSYTHISLTDMCAMFIQLYMGNEYHSNDLNDASTTHQLLDTVKSIINHTLCSHTPLQPPSPSTDPPDQSKDTSGATTQQPPMKLLTQPLLLLTSVHSQHIQQCTMYLPFIASAFHTTYASHSVIFTQCHQMRIHHAAHCHIAVSNITWIDWIDAYLAQCRDRGGHSTQDAIQSPISPSPSSSPLSSLPSPRWDEPPITHLQPSEQHKISPIMEYSTHLSYDIFPWMWLIGDSLPPFHMDCRLHGHLHLPGATPIASRIGTLVSSQQPHQALHSLFTLLMDLRVHTDQPQCGDPQDKTMLMVLSRAISQTPQMSLLQVYDFSWIKTTSQSPNIVYPHAFLEQQDAEPTTWGHLMRSVIIFTLAMKIIQRYQCIPS